jgi:microcin C transport system substrate-binding protein
VAYWDEFSHPAKLPRYFGTVGAIELWWHESVRAAKTEQAK